MRSSRCVHGIAVLEVDRLVKDPVLPAGVPVVPVPSYVVWAGVGVGVVDEDPPGRLHVLRLQVVDYVETVVEQSLVVEVDEENFVLCSYSLVDRPVPTVSVAVLEPRRVFKYCVPASFGSINRVFTLCQRC